MASREDDFANRMEADATLMATLTGGVYAAGEVGLEGISRDTTPSAFSSGYLLPAALVRQRSDVPDNAVWDEATQHTSFRQVVEIYLYEDRGYSSIDTAAERLFQLFQGYQFTSPNPSFPVKLINKLDRFRDEGALKGNSLARLDFEVFTVRS
jgi:hypothetical protein